MGKGPSYLSSAALSAHNDRLVDWLDQALDIPVGLFTHPKDVGLQFLKQQGVKGHLRECLSSRSGWSNAGREGKAAKSSAGRLPLEKFPGCNKVRANCGTPTVPLPTHLLSVWKQCWP